MLNKTLKSLEYDKILSSTSEYAVLNSTKKFFVEFNPTSDIKIAKFMLNNTEEAYNLLYKYNVGGIFYFGDVTDELIRADKGSTLNIAEILRVNDNLKSARILKNSILSVNDDQIIYLKEIAKRLFINQEFEDEISKKILNEDTLSDTASEKLYSIRKSIRTINAKIRDSLNSFMHGNLSKYLQDGVVTMRQNRYVVPVKSEYRSFVKGFIHDQSSSGSTVFIEPEIVIELNNDLKKAFFDEEEEIHRILAELSSKISFMSEGIRYNVENITEIDSYYARAQYSFKNKCSKPILNDKGYINIKRGRHPLISPEKVVPVSIKLGEKYNFLLITGPNTGGKTVSLKLCGLLTLIASSGLYIPADDESEISVFNGVFCDIGDEQSIEQNLSTFSSHILNIKYILENIDDKSLVLLDELGAGTDPEEGSALALAIIERLLNKNSFGIVTTHYSKLKEFAVNNGKIENASMEFDSNTLEPLYKLNVGIPGSSNAIYIAQTLGIDDDIIQKATMNLSDDKVSFEGIIKKAEESRLESEKLKDELDCTLKTKEEELSAIKFEKEKLIKEREKISLTAKQETKRIVAEKLTEAEEIIDELKSILKKAQLESKEVFRASELKNRLQNSRYLSETYDNAPMELIRPKIDELKIGNIVYVKSLDTKAKILSINKNKNEIEVLVGTIKAVVKTKDIYNNENTTDNVDVRINKSVYSQNPLTEINVIGKTELEAITELENFIDQALINNLEKIKIIHGVGEGVLLKSIREYLKKDKNVLEFRRGKYGEGENGVTIVTLK